MNIFKINKLNSFNLFENIENFFKKTRQDNISVDISELNLIDASRTALLCSTRFFAKYPDKKIRWSVADEETKSIISNLKLNNMELDIKQEEPYSTTIADSKVFLLK